MNSGSRPTKHRRTRADIEVIRSAIVAALEADAPMTVRQVFYRLVSAGVIAKTEAEYKQTVGRLLVAMRADGTIDYGEIADSTRWMRKPTTYDSIEDALQATAQLYRRNIWRDLPEYVEVWCEKDALAGVIYGVTEEYGVPLMVTRGYPSLSYLHGAAEAMVAELLKQKSVHVYYFGDHDPSGLDIDRSTERQLRTFIGARVHVEGGGDLPFFFDRVAILPWQITAYDLQTRPTKQTDSRTARFGDGGSVELDALAPGNLRAIVRERIEGHLPYGALDAAHVAEESERSILRAIASRSRPTNEDSR